MSVLLIILAARGHVATAVYVVRAGYCGSSLSFLCAAAAAALFAPAPPATAAPAAR